MSERVGLINISTGQLLEEGFLAFEKPRKKMPFGTWFLTNQKALEHISNLTHMTDVKVLVKLLSAMPAGNSLAVTQKQLAADMGLNPVQVSQSMKRLTEAKLIRKEGTAYIVNEDLAWKGKLDDFPHQTRVPLGRVRKRSPRDAAQTAGKSRDEPIQNQQQETKP